MISPSVFKMKRSTPCVDGWCGPMLRTISSVLRGVPSTAAPGVSALISAMRFLWVPWPPSLVFPPVVDPGVVRGVHVVLPQRVPDPVLRAEDPPQIGIAFELDADQVVRLALEPARAAPQERDRRHARLPARKLHLHRE